MNEERLGRENILKLVVRMALPAMLTMAFQALYNAFDSLFIARYSSHAFASISITQPIINISLSISAGIGAGMAGCISRYLGQRNKSSAENVLKSAAAVKLHFEQSGDFFLKSVGREGACK